MLLCAVMLMNGTALSASKSTPVPSQQPTIYEKYNQTDAQLRIAQLKNKDNYRQVPSYDAWEREPSKYTGSKYTFTGTVVQVSEGASLQYRIALDGKASQLILVTYQRDEDELRILEDDKVVVYGTCKGVTSYQSTIGSQVTIPSVQADLITVQVTIKDLRRKSVTELKRLLTQYEDEITKKAAKNTQGAFLITRKNYDDYARRVKPHMNESVSWNGKILQIQKQGATTVLRISVDSTQSVILVKADKDSMKEQLLEDDEVTVSGKYQGVTTYESTLGGNITIPLCRAESIKRKKAASSVKLTAGKSGYYTLNASTYDEFFRHADQYIGKKVELRGEVIQAIDSWGEIQYRVKLKDNGSDVVYATADSSVTRMLNGDTVTIYGEFTGTVTYESTLGAEITIPSVAVEKVTIDGYQEKKSNTNSGSYSIKKSNYNDFARNGDQYKGAKVSFTGTVIQAIDDTDTCTYRIAVDGSSSCVVLAELETDKLHTRILEDDKVKVKGVFTGLYSYSSTLGGKITVPSCTLTEYTITNYKKPQEPQKDSHGYYVMTKSNYESYARTSAKHEGEPVKVTGKVLQVMEGYSNQNTYRIAVGGDSNRVVYVKYTLPSGKKRLLEGDTVTLIGKYIGLYTYTTILGSSVTIPAIEATLMKAR